MPITNSPPPPPAWLNSANCVFCAKNGDAVMIASGTIVPFSLCPIEIEVPMGAFPSLKLRLVFETDKDQKTQKMELRTYEIKTPELVFTNLNSPIGGGPTEPIALWTATTADGAEVEVIASLWFHSRESKLPVIHFSFFQQNRIIIGKEAK